MSDNVARFQTTDADELGRASLTDLVLSLLGRDLFPEAAAAPDDAEATYLFERRRLFPDATDYRQVIETAVQRPHDRDLSLCRLTSALGFTPIETACAAMALAVETDVLIGRVIAYLQSPLGGSRPTLGLLAHALGRAAGAADTNLEARLSAGRVFATGLLRLLGEGPLPERTVSMPLAFVHNLTGVDTSWPGVRFPNGATYASWPGSVMTQASRFASGLAEPSGAALLIRGASGLELDAIVRTMAAELGRKPVLVDPAKLEARGFGALCVAGNYLPVFICNLAPADYLELPDLPGYAGPVVAAAGCDGRVGVAGGRVVEWTVPLPTADERAGLWRETFGDGDMVHRLGRDHLQSAGRIRELSETALAYARLAGQGQPGEADLRRAAWASEGEGLGTLAQPVYEEIPENALVLGPILRGELGIALARCRSRETLADDLGATLAARYKVGVKLLFVGPSGTGKTLAASWLANRLGLPLYRVDLASVTSKYIGETEKNLARLLARAEQDEVMLLFDEADSLFGKRTDIQDSNDRFANAQTNYLLQRIETYSGIVVLTSNSKARFDDAFTRRIDMIVDFPQPDAEERRALWIAHLGGGHRVRPGELNRLSSLAELTGGHIRNVVLTAAVLARRDGGELAFRHLLSGLRVEYRKLGWTVPAELSADRADREAAS